MQATDSAAQSIVIKNLCHTYKDGTKALDNINLEIGVGLFGLLGANGAGKSTLMQILCTLLEPSSGEVNIGGFDLIHERTDIRKILGYLPQEFGAWRLQKVIDLLHTLGALSGMNDKHLRSRRISEILEQVGLQDVARRSIRELSGGMLRRVGVAQALLHDPKVVVMDEPSVGLDPEERQRFRQLIAKLSRDRIIILSTHIISDLSLSCTDLALINKGNLEFRGTPEELINLASGQVYELSLNSQEAEALELSDDFEIVTRSFRQGQSILRGVVKQGEPPKGAQSANKIALEEAYLAFTLNKAKQAVAR